MANDRTKKPGDSAPEAMSPLERYLAKQKQDKALQAAKESPPTKARGLSGHLAAKLGVKTGAPETARATVGTTAQERPSLAGIERPPASEPPQPPSLRRWESVVESRLSDVEQRAREAGAPPIPPLHGSAGEEATASRGLGSRPSQAATSSGAAASSIAGFEAGAGSGGDFVRPITHSAQASDEARNASFGPRFVAATVDGCIVVAMSSVAEKIVSAILSLVANGLVEAHSSGFAMLIQMAVVYAYYGYFYSTKGASPGKLLLNLEVLDTDGVTRLTPWKAFFRESIGKVISTIPFFMGYIIVLIRHDHRALHDLLFDTRVVKKSAGHV